MRALHALRLVEMTKWGSDGGGMTKGDEMEWGRLEGVGDI